MSVHETNGMERRAYASGPQVPYVVVVLARLGGRNTGSTTHVYICANFSTTMILGDRG